MEVGIKNSFKGMAKNRESTGLGYEMHTLGLGLAELNELSCMLSPQGFMFFRLMSKL